MNRAKVARQLLVLANEIMAAEEEEKIDEQFASKVRSLKTQMSKLTQKKRKRLKQFGVGVIRPSTTVEGLVDILTKIVAEA